MLYFSKRYTQRVGDSSTTLLGGQLGGIIL